MPQYPDTGLLSLLDEEMRNIMFPYGNFMETAPGQVIITKGELPNFYIVITGSFQVSIQGKHANVTLENVPAGDCFGEMCLFNKAGATATVTGLDSGRLWYTNLSQFQRFLYDSDVAGCALLVGINTILSRRLKLANQLIRKSRIKPTFVSVRHRERHFATNLLGSLSPHSHHLDRNYLPEECKLKAVGVMSYLTDESLRILSEYGDYDEYVENTEIMRENSDLDRIFVVLTGRLEVYSEIDASPVHLGFAEPGECLGELSLFDPGPASASVQVAERAVLWSMGRDALGKLICEDPGLCGALLFGIAHGLEERLRHADELIARDHTEVVQTPLRNTQRITPLHPAQVSCGLFKVLNMAKQVGARFLKIRHREGTIKAAPPKVQDGVAPEDQLAYFKAQDLGPAFLSERP